MNLAKILHKETRQLLEKIGAVADKNQLEVYIVGGFVRDVLLGRDCVDLDFVVVGDGPACARLVADELGVKNIVIYEKFQTAFIPFHDYKIEFVSARSESYHSESRKPEVEQADLSTDILRRDFTINAMAMAINANNFGELVDQLGGQDDLEQKLIRTPLDPIETFIDDPLRIMRAIRFAAQLGFLVEEKTFAAIHQTVERLEIISMERIRDEFLKIMMTEKPSIGLWHLYNTGILELILPELTALYGVEDVGGKRHKNNLSHTFQVVDQICPFTDDVNLRLAALFHDIGKTPTKKFLPNKGWTFHNHEFIGAKMIRPIFTRFKLPKESSKYVTKLVRLHMRPVSLTEEIVTDSAIRRMMVQANEHLEDLLILAQADITSRNPERRSRKLQKFEKVKERIAEVREKDELRAFQSPVRGEEIMQLMNIAPGPEIGIIKKQIEEAILDGVIPNEYEAAKEYLLNVLMK